MRRSVHARLVVFAVLSAIMVGFTGARYAQLTDRFLDTRYTVTVDLPESGGLFAGAEVTYRGVPIGRVEDVELADEGVVARLRIREEWQVPDDATAHVRNRSAVGEQYIDLVPGREGGPYLEDGSHLDVSRASIPLGEDELVKTIDTFVQSVNVEDLRTVVRELGVGFRGSGVHLRTLLDGLSTFVSEANAHLPETVDLLRHTRTVLTTQQVGATSIRSFADSLARLTTTLRDNDPALRTLLQDGVPAAQEVTALINGLAGPLPTLLQNLTALGELTGPRMRGLDHVLSMLPYIVAAVQAGTRNGRSYLGLALNQTPSACQSGYIPPSEWRSAHDVSVVPAPDDVRCAEPGLVWRGTEHAP